MSTLYLVSSLALVNPCMCSSIAVPAMHLPAPASLSPPGQVAGWGLQRAPFTWHASFPVKAPSVPTYSLLLEESSLVPWARFLTTYPTQYHSQENVLKCFLGAQISCIDSFLPLSPLHLFNHGLVDEAELSAC